MDVAVMPTVIDTPAASPLPGDAKSGASKESDAGFASLLAGLVSAAGPGEGADPQPSSGQPTDRAADQAADQTTPTFIPPGLWSFLVPTAAVATAPDGPGSVRLVSSKVRLSGLA